MKSQDEKRIKEKARKDISFSIFMGSSVRQTIVDIHFNKYGAYYTGSVKESFSYIIILFN